MSDSNRNAANPASPSRQLDDEPDEAYVRFLFYLGLGPARTIESACKSFENSNRAKKRKEKPSVQYWWKLSSQFKWLDRAARYDIEQLSIIVPQTTTLIFQAVQEFARRTLQNIQTTSYEPKNWEQLREDVIILAGLVSPEVIARAADYAPESRDGEPVPASGGGEGAGE